MPRFEAKDVSTSEHTVFLHLKNINALYDVAQKELVLVTNWLSANKLTLNINKTKFIVFTSNKKKGIKTDKSLYVNDIPIEKVHAISFLGLPEVESSKTSLASRTSSRTHFEVLDLGLEGQVLGLEA